MDVKVRVYVMRGARDTVARPLLFRELVDDLVDASALDVVIERDASVEQSDRRVIYARLAERGKQGTISYVHRNRREQPMLWIPDAVAWCYQAGGVWPAKVATIIDEVIEVRRP